MFTGLNLYNHGIRHIVGDKLSPEVPTLAELLGEQGYETAAFIRAHALTSEFDLDHGFDHLDHEFDEQTENWKLGYSRDCEEVTARALDWLSEQEDHPWFIFLHYFDAHGGNVPSSEPRYKREITKILELLDELAGAVERVAPEPRGALDEGVLRRFSMERYADDLLGACVELGGA